MAKQITGIIETMHKYAWADFFIMTLLTALSVYNGQATVFYIIYLFWWREFLNLIFNRRFVKKNAAQGNTSKTKNEEEFSPFFMLLIYWVFIVIIFGFIANWSHPKLFILNMNILLFKNVFFNLNLLYIVLELIWINSGNIENRIRITGITPNMIVLHISIVVGGLLVFFVVKKYPQIFAPDQLLGSLVIIAPFLLLRFGMQVFAGKRRGNLKSLQKDNSNNE